MQALVRTARDECGQAQLLNDSLNRSLTHKCLRQVRLLTVNDEVAPYAHEVVAEMRRHGIRAQVCSLLCTCVRTAMARDEGDGLCATCAAAQTIRRAFSHHETPGLA
jgi:hypothetical protein